MLVKKQSIISGNVNEMELDITQEQLDRYLEGRELIQDIFPHLNANEREFLITGITGEEWDLACWDSASDLVT